MSRHFLIAFFSAVSMVYSGHLYAGLPAGSVLIEPRGPEPMILEQGAIEADRVEVVFNSAGEVVQVNACESERLCTQARLLPARDIQFFMGNRRLSLDVVQELGKRAATITYDADTSMVEKVSYFEVTGGERDE
ncbi:hypothetical protein [Marinobacter zhejiangensis]|uniref:Uncharacterized protein n=1 Tax=Marinobacter zhejiangensis TaxID=488535 RepID=A0A1I4S7F8_9GAMM|nr:hypothetical protein [Marinobacter zhejiangensis]SFM60432.1 hypothetical protein SAMN04487963_3065 [Marinobacter zhejiangensis]